MSRRTSRGAHVDPAVCRLACVRPRGGTMTFSGLTRAALAFAAATALAVSAQPSHAQQADGPGFGAPSVGTCSTMTAPQAAAAADRSTRVPCAQAHTARVAGVVQLPDRL